MIRRQAVQQKLEVIFSLYAAGRHQFLDQLEHRYNMPFLWFGKLRNEQDDRCHQPFGSVIKEGVLTISGSVTVSIDECLGNDFRIFFRPCFQSDIIGIFLVGVHIFVDEMQQVVPVRLGRIPQINDCHVVMVILLCDSSIIPIEVAFGIGRQEGHPAGAGIFQIWIQPVGCFSAASCADHHAVNVRVIHKGNGFPALVFAADNDALWQLRRLVFLCLSSPCAGRERYLPIGPPDF